MNAPRQRFVLLVSLSLQLAACRSTGAWDRHTTMSPWVEGLSAQADDPWQWGAEATMVGLVPVALAADHQIAIEAPEDSFVSGGDTTGGDIGAIALGVAPLVLGVWSWSHGDGGRAFEVASESLLGTFAATHALKLATGRTRPDGSNDDSFPSGHTSWAFAGATYIGRYVDDAYDSKLGYLAWLPATYVGISRLEGNKHWTSDVVVGALLGTFLTNWIWNSHYGPSDHSLFTPTHRTVWSAAPFGDENAVGLSLTVSF